MELNKDKDTGTAKKRPGCKQMEEGRRRRGGEEERRRGVEEERGRGGEEQRRRGGEEERRRGPGRDRAREIRYGLGLGLGISRTRFEVPAVRVQTKISIKMCNPRFSDDSTSGIRRRPSVARPTSAAQS